METMKTSMPTMTLLHLVSTLLKPTHSFKSQLIKNLPSSYRLFSSIRDDKCPLSFTTLPYSAAEVKVDKKHEDINDDSVFLDNLRSSIDFWKANDKISAWVHVPMNRARLVEDLTNSDFKFELHHTNNTEQTIVLKRWLVDNTEDKIPPFATHQVGCAGFVLNDKNELLVIREWSGPPSNRVASAQWKLPGGLLDAGESLPDATCREVREETGVDCEFESILTFWHRHGLTFGKSDMYFVCLLKPKTLEIAIDPVEVSFAKWMSVDDFVKTQDHPLIHHVLQNSFLVDKSTPVGSSQRLEPSAEMREGFVQWPNRPKYLTYTSKKG
mmetsp:Transcript_903/g.1115  ORF Transcript_903/g.1115 Transcript_903/m.1115 type:complete len:326 (+) Transcript_903:42-1019(+)